MWSQCAFRLGRRYRRGFMVAGQRIQLGCGYAHLVITFVNGKVTYSLRGKELFGPKSQ